MYNLPSHYRKNSFDSTSTMTDLTMNSNFTQTSFSSASSLSSAFSDTASFNLTNHSRKTNNTITPTSTLHRQYQYQQQQQQQQYQQPSYQHQTSTPEYSSSHGSRTPTSPASSAYSAATANPHTVSPLFQSIPETFWARFPITTTKTPTATKLFLPPIPRRSNVITKTCKTPRCIQYLSTQCLTEAAVVLLCLRTSFSRPFNSIVWSPLPLFGRCPVRWKALNPHPKRSNPRVHGANSKTFSTTTTTVIIILIAIPALNPRHRPRHPLVPPVLRRSHPTYPSTPQRQATIRSTHNFPK